MSAGISPAFAALLASGSGYQVVARLEVLDVNGAVVLDSAESTVLKATAGQIQVDSRASFTRQVSGFTVADETGEFIPMSKDDFFSAAANVELRLSVGAMVDGAPEYVSQGRFQLDRSVVRDTAEGLTLTISAYDRARKYSRAKRYTARRFLASGDPGHLAGWYAYEAITALLQDAFSGTTVNHDSPTFMLPEQDVLPGDDPWETAREWAESIGYMLYFDRDGACQLRKVPDPNAPGATVNWRYAEGEGGLIGLVRDQSNEGVINGCGVEGVNPSNGEPVRSEMIWDDDVDSATYYLGPYGRVPMFIQSDKVRTIEQGNAMARAQVNQNKGLVEAVEFDIVPNPAIDPLDTVQLVRQRSGFDESGVGSEAVIVDSYTVNVSATGGAMTVQCRQRRVSSG